MPKVNTLFNYFTSPKGAKRTESPTTSEKLEKKIKSPMNGNKVATPHRRRGKENKDTPDRKRTYKSEPSDDDNPENSPRKKGSQPKKRRIVIPSDNSDSGEEFKPDQDENTESDGSASEGVSESEPETESEEESPQKKVRMSKTSGKKGTKANSKAGNQNSGRTKNNAVGAKNKTANKELAVSDGQNQSQVNGNIDSWPHLKYPFLQPGKIKDAKGRSTDHPDYDPKTLYVPKDFLNSVTPGVRQWWELKSTHFDCVIFFKVGKFYELYHMDAVTGVNELSLTYMRGEFAHSGFPEIGYGRYSASLIERGYKVARVEQTENPEMMSQRCSKMHKPTKFDKVVKREICQISTRGTRVYTPLDVEASTPNSTYLLSLTEKQAEGVSAYGVCFLDTTIGEFNLGEFTDDRSNSRLLTLFAHYPPAQIVYEKGNLSARTLQILNSCLSSALKEPLQRSAEVWCAARTLKTLHEGSYFKPEEVGEIKREFSWPEGLKPYLNDKDSLGLTPADDKELAVKALGGCIHLLKEYLLDQQLLAQQRFSTYLPPDMVNEQLEDSNVEHIRENIEARNMVLDAATINNLRLFGEGSLCSKLDRCCTAFGKRLLREWLCRPSRAKTTIIHRQNAIQALLDHPDVMQSAKQILNGIPDLERLLSKIHAQGNFAKMFDHPDGRAIMFEGHTYSKRKIVDFTNTLDGFAQILKVTELFDNFEDDLIKKCTRTEPDGEFPNIEAILDYFKTAFDHEEAKKEGCIVPKRGVDKEYDSVLLELDEIEEDAKTYLESQRKYFGVKVTYHGSDRKRYQIEIPDSQVKKVGVGYELQSQRKGFRRYYTAEGREILSRQTNAEEHRDRVLKDLNRRIFAKFSDHFDTFSLAIHKISTLDVLLSLAEYSQSIDTCVPEILSYSPTSSCAIEIKDGRHPCITNEDFIPNDTTLGDLAESASFVILTGPNMGGKSTLMRQVGLLTIMAQIGSLVPASQCRLHPVDRIFTRLGANDDILAGQSTFLVELTETSTILRHASRLSLVLLDELGRGTSTYDGTAIAASVVDRLVKLKCRTLFSTHYHSLVEDYKSDSKVCLMHMACMVETEEEESVGQETVTFLYKLANGACPKSYGFNAARLAGVPVEITKRGHAIAEKLENNTNCRRFFANICKAKEADLKSILSLLKEKVK